VVEENTECFDLIKEIEEIRHIIEIHVKTRESLALDDFFKARKIIWKSDERKCTVPFSKNH